MRCIHEATYAYCRHSAVTCCHLAWRSERLPACSGGPIALLCFVGVEVIDGLPVACVPRADAAAAVLVVSQLCTGHALLLYPFLKCA